jgi:SAM-dependent methyltransferase
VPEADDDADRRMFAEAYKGTPPWDIGRPQPAFVELANAGSIVGRVLDVGCGTGENALDFAERGLEATGVDIVPAAIARAKAKAKERGVEASFLVHDALDLPALRQTFDTVIDCGLFHILSDAGRMRYQSSVGAVLRPGGMLYLMCFSDKEDASWGGPRRVSDLEIYRTFEQGWSVHRIEEARFLSNYPQIRGHAWLAYIERLPKDAPKKKEAAETEPPHVRVVPRPPPGRKVVEAPV